MQSLGKIPDGAPGWQKFHRHVFRMVGCACGNPQMGTDMLLAAEAWTGEPTAFRIDESWEKVDSLFAVRLIEAFSNNLITRR